MLLRLFSSCSKQGLLSSCGVQPGALTQTSKLAAAPAAAKSLQSCLTLCDPIDGSPPGIPVPGILQARTSKLGEPSNQAFPLLLFPVSTTWGHYGEAAPLLAPLGSTLLCGLRSLFRLVHRVATVLLLPGSAEGAHMWSFPACSP